MKKVYYTLLLFVLAPVMGFSQQENVIVDTNKIWSIVQENCHPWGNTYTTFYMKFSGDTVVESHNYKKIHVSYTEDHSEWELFSGLIRENDEKQVFFRTFNSDEGMLYDFDIELNDTVSVVNPRLMMQPVVMYVSEVDSVPSSQGYLTKYTMAGVEYSGEDIWYEEIGSIASVLNSTYPLFGQSCGAWEFLCMMESNNLIYSNPDYETCYYELVGVEEQPSIEKIKIAPNPATDYIRIKNPGQVNAKLVTLRDLTGKLIEEYKNINEAKTISLPDLRPGIYLINIISEKGERVSRKLMVE
ncbi:MAG: T9SS type A sorting domain-containing protein [Bacteroidales bacterium]|nr:T9SS type A sorting domain-containing protein [Bacteroidales bacterium]